MSDLDIVLIESKADFELLRKKYHDWFAEKPERRARFSVDTLEPIMVQFPIGQEKETLRTVLKKAREDGLSFRFWWAARRSIGAPIGLQISFETMGDSNGFDNLIEPFVINRAMQP